MRLIIHLKDISNPSNAKIKRNNILFFRGALTLNRTYPVFVMLRPYRVFEVPFNLFLAIVTKPRTYLTNPTNSNER